MQMATPGGKANRLTACRARYAQIHASGLWGKRELECLLNELLDLSSLLDCRFESPRRQHLFDRSGELGGRGLESFERPHIDTTGFIHDELGPDLAPDAG